ncbi:MAG: HIT family protein [Candidatus Roizmanbacteria bacterium]
MSTIFDKIIKREIPSYILYEDSLHIVILDIYPMHPGQVLIIPKKSIDYIFDMADSEYVRLMSLSKKVAIHMKKVLKAERIGMVLEGLEVPHVHVKLIPIDHTHPLDPQYITKLSSDKASRLQELLRIL